MTRSLGPPSSRLRQGVTGGVRDSAVNLLIRSQAEFAFPFTSSGSLGHALAHGRAVGGRGEILWHRAHVAYRSVVLLFHFFEICFIF